jgi:hypothetical protein
MRSFAALAALVVLLAAPGVRSQGNSAPNIPPAALETPLQDADEAAHVELLLVLLSIVPVLYVSGFLHEMGHAVLGELSGIRVMAFGMGTGRMFLVRSWGEMKIHLGLRRPFQGLTLFFMEDIYPSRRQLIGGLLGGIVAHLVVVIGLALWALLPWGGLFWVVVVVSNALLALVHALPIVVRVGPATLRSDGAQVLSVLRQGGLVVSPTEMLAMSALLRPMVQEIDHHVADQLYLLLAVEGWRALEVPERAEQLHRERPAGFEPPAALRGLFELSAGLIACSCGRMTEAADAVARAEAIFLAPNHPAGLFLVEAGRIELLERKGEHQEALAALDTLAGHPLVRFRTELQGQMLALRMKVLVALGAEAEVLKLRWEYERLRRRGPSGVRDMDVYRTLGRWFAAKESRTEAAEAYGLALKAIRQVYDSLHDGDDQERFLTVHRAGLLAEIKRSLRQAGKETEVEAVDSLFVPRTAVQQRAAEAKRKQDRRRRWAAVGVTALNLVMVIAGFAALVAFGRANPGKTRLVKAGALVLATFLVCSLFNTVFLVVDLVLGFLVPSRWRGGLATILLGLLPWAAAVTTTAALFTAELPD